MTRLSMYVDGWNFYYSLKGAGIREYGWCNFPMLAKQQTSEKDAEVKVKCFTSVDKPNKEKIDRPNVHLVDGFRLYEVRHHQGGVSRHN